MQIDHFLGEKYFSCWLLAICETCLVRLRALLVVMRTWLHLKSFKLSSCSQSLRLLLPPPFKATCIDNWLNKQWAKLLPAEK